MATAAIDSRPLDAATAHTHPPAAALAGAPLALAAVIGLVLLAFGLPAVKAAPRDVPIGVAGPAAATSQVIAALEHREPGAFAVTSFATEAELANAIRDREVYGGISVGPQGTGVLTASAASPVVAQALTAIGAGLAAQQSATATTTDVVALPADDPRGAGLGAGMLPLVIGAILPAAALGQLARRRWVQLGGALVYSVVAGATFAAVLHYALGTLAGSYWAEATVIAATIGAGTVALLGLQWVAGRVGLALGSLVLVLLGNPLSGAMSAPEFLASPWREIGQGMPPGAGSQLLRSVAFFDGAGATTGWWVLGAWAVGGLVLMALPVRRAARPTPA